MDIMSKGRKTFTQSYNPKCIIVGEKVSKNQIVYRFYSSLDNMSASDGVAYRVAAARRLKSLERC